MSEDTRPEDIREDLSGALPFSHPPQSSTLRGNALPFFRPAAPPIQPAYPTGLVPQPWATAYATQGNLWQNSTQSYYPWPFYNPNWQWYGYAPLPPQPAQQPAYGSFQHVGHPEDAGHPDFSQAQQRTPPPEPHEEVKLGQNVLTSQQSSKKKKNKKKNTNLWNRTGGNGAAHGAAHHPDSVEAPDLAQLPDRTKVSKSQPVAGSGRRTNDSKIMLPAPLPTTDYLIEAFKTPSQTTSPRRMLVILDLNGTLLYRPNSKNPRRFIERPFLEPFLRYLFDNFSVMIWSSARPQNVQHLVDQALPKEFNLKLVARWARDTFGLSDEHYDLNVQVYKNLDKIWSDPAIQASHPGSANGETFNQYNTILIDDTVLKANAQPHNLMEIPEFKATSEQMKSDVLREVAGYLEVARQHDNVSAFMRQEPFKADGKWQYDWLEEAVSNEAVGGPIVANGNSLGEDAFLSRRLVRF